MLVVVSDPEMQVGEADMINELFLRGMEIFHLRKPGSKREEMESIVMQIESRYHGRMVLHQHRELTPGSSVRRHYSEMERKMNHDAEWRKMKTNGMILSTSIHKIKDADDLFPFFDYAFLGPVFDSISKSDYRSTIRQDLKLEKQQTKLIAIGGISISNVEKTFAMGFDGIAVCGAIWRSGSPVKMFTEIQKECSLHGQ